MKPLPIQQEALRPRPANAIRVNRRPVATSPLLLVASTLLAGVFCLLYLTKPVVEIAAAPEFSAPADPAAEEPAAAPTPQAAGKDAPPVSPLPTSPADLAAASPAKPASPADAFEETNLKIQHVLSVVSEEGELGRIVTDVPVLYQTRMLRWDAAQVTRARQLLAQLDRHQQKSRELRAEGIILLDAWQSLVAASIPAPVLRADSPTLPANQPGETGSSRPRGLETSESIEIETAANR